MAKTGVSGAALARALGVHRSAVDNQKRQEWLERCKHRDGSYNLKKAVQAWTENIDPAKSMNGKMRGKKKQVTDAEKMEVIKKAEAIAGPEALAGLKVTYENVRLGHEYYKMSLAKLDHEQKSKQLIPVQSGINIIERIVGTMINHLDSIPARCGALVAAEGDPFTCGEILKKEIYAVRTEMNNSLLDLESEITGA